MNTLIKRAFPIGELQRIKKWQVVHRPGHEIEYQTWDAVLTLWLMGCVGWLLLPVVALPLDLLWVVPLCAFATAAPELYIHLRKKAHLRQRLRCDWIHLAD